MQGPNLIDNDELSAYDDNDTGVNENGEGNFSAGVHPHSGFHPLAHQPSNLGNMIAHHGSPSPENFEHNSTTSLDDHIGGTEVMSCAKFKMVDQMGMAKSAILSEVVFIPQFSKTISPKDVMDLVQKTWGLTPANMLINCDAGSMHPKALATQKLSAQPQFSTWMEDSEAQLRLKREGTDTSAPVSPTELAEECNIVINQLIFQRLLTIFSAVLDAASLSNNWILINRASSTGSSATAELMLELAMEQTSQRPVIIVVESFNRLRRFTNDDAKEQIALLEKLREISEPITAYDSNDFRVVKMNAKYSIEEFDNYEWWTDLATHPIPSVPHKADLQANGLVGERARWGYHYQSAMFTSGTHYIILDGDETVFPISALGSVGNVCANGSTRAYKRIRSVIQDGRPLVMLNNTGGVTQAFASLHKALGEAIHTSEDEEDNKSEAILKKLEIMNNVDQWTKTFGIPEIMMFKELNQRAPMLFQKTIVVVDLVKDSAEDVLSTVTACFASSACGVPELGIGNAESAVVYNAWKRHLVLYLNSASVKKEAVTMFVTNTLLGLATAAMSTIYANASNINMSEDIQSITNTFIILLPILSALCVSILTTQRFNEKWKICDMGASMIVSEIYNFRAGTDVYMAKIAGSENGDEEEGDRVGTGLNQATKNRNLFVKKVSSIFTRVMESDVGKSGSLVYGSVLKADTSMGQESFFHKKTLRPHVESNLIKTKDARFGSFSEMQQLAGGGKKKNSNKVVSLRRANDGIDIDDLISPLTIETYVEYRAKPLTDYYEKATPVWARRLGRLESLGFVLTSMGAVLAVPGINLGSWVAITVAMSTAVNATVEYFQLKTERDTRNATLGDFQNLMTWWESLSIIDKRTNKAKLRALNTVEKGILLLVERRAGAAFGTDQTEEAEEEEAAQ